MEEKNISAGHQRRKSGFWIFGFSKSILDFSGFSWIFLDFGGFSWILPDFTGFYRIFDFPGFLDFTVISQIFWDSTVFFWIYSFLPGFLILGHHLLCTWYIGYAIMNRSLSILTITFFPYTFKRHVLSRTMCLEILYKRCLACFFTKCKSGKLY